MALGFLNRCIWRASSSGSGSFVVASAITGNRTPETCANPAVVNAATYRYFAQSDDKTQWEIGVGVYTTADDTLTRATILDSSNSGSVVTFSAAPSVFMGGPLANDVAFRGYENVTTDNATPIEFDQNVLITYVTSDGSGLEQTITGPSLGSGGDGLTHLIVFRTQSDPSDVIRVGSTLPADFLLQVDGDLNYVVLTLANGSWIVSFGSGSFDDVPDDYPRVPSIGISGALNFLSSTESTTWYRLQQNVTVVAGSASTDPAFYATSLTTDGSAGSQTINIDSADLPSKYNIPHLIYVSSQTDPADTVTVTASDGIIGSETITLGASGSWACFILTAGGWLPFTFGGGTTTSATGSRVLTLADTGGLSWV